MSNDLRQSFEIYFVYQSYHGINDHLGQCSICSEYIQDMTVELRSRLRFRAFRVEIPLQERMKLDMVRKRTRLVFMSLFHILGKFSLV